MSRPTPAPAPAEPAAERVRTRAGQQPPRPGDDAATVAAILAVLAAGYAAGATATGIAHILAPWGITARAVGAALALVGNGGRASKRSAVIPAATPADLTGVLRAARAQESYFRAAYLANAAQRIAYDLRAGDSLAETIDHERRNADAHHAAVRQRHDAIDLTAHQAALHGPILGWYLDPFLNNEAECIAADGHNFDARRGTSIGYPGMVHVRCGCRPGPPHAGGMANSVEAALRKARVEGIASTRRYRLRVVS